MPVPSNPFILSKPVVFRGEKTMQPIPMQPGAGAAQQPMYQPQYIIAQHSPVDHLKPLASDFLLAVGAIIGIFLLMLGTLIYGLSLHGDVYNLGKVIAAFGVFIVSVVLLMGAIVRIDLDKLVRFGYIIAAVAILVWIGFW